MAHFNCTRILTVVLVITGSTAAIAHEPNRECTVVRQRVDLIGPVGNRLEPSMRRTHNRPTFLGGRLAYIVAPTSQEAMTWHKADHRGAYKNECPRIEPRYFYPKPWEALQIGPRVSLKPSTKPAELRSLKDINLSQDEEAPDVLALPEDGPAALRDDVIGSGVDKDAVNEERSQHQGAIIDEDAVESPSDKVSDEANANGLTL